MKHLALPVSDQERSRRFYESYFGFDAEPARRYDDGVLMLYNADGFSLALGPTQEAIRLPTFLHFGIVWGAQTRSSLQTGASRPSDRIYAPHAIDAGHIQPTRIDYVGTRR